jgi:hypothetical protein
MNQRITKLLRPMFENKQDFRRFKKAYTRGGLEKRLQTISVAKRIRSGGTIHHMEFKDGR